MGERNFDIILIQFLNGFSPFRKIRVLTERDNLNFLTKSERERLHCETTSNFLKMKLRSTYPEVQRLLQKDYFQRLKNFSKLIEKSLP